MDPRIGTNKQIWLGGDDCSNDSPLPLDLTLTGGLRRHQEKCTREEDVIVRKEDEVSCCCCCGCCCCGWTGGVGLEYTNECGNEDNNVVPETAPAILDNVLAPSSFTVLWVVLVASELVVVDVGGEGNRNKGWTIMFGGDWCVVSGTSEFCSEDKSTTNNCRSEEELDLPEEGDADADVIVEDQYKLWTSSFRGCCATIMDDEATNAKYCPLGFCPNREENIKEDGPDNPAKTKQG